MITSKSFKKLIVQAKKFLMQCRKEIRQYKK
ncbi:hypothetical protein NC653_000209 [Populus alba x Populus x berolinensis]|uniref:Uncharacterized protein n=1 Tax=Populus alba x Populus x berolinensis TaxID=444605 RepID=A0AAD6RIK0_9ROSI|nr:hypothetical protein NC653_000209 [Populus alba x Populus x berolinensis]